jgi:hypothetical protein
MSEEKPVKTEIDYERGALLLKVQSMAAAAGPSLVALLGEASAELAEMAEKAGENLKVRSEELKAKAAKMEADLAAKKEAEAKAAEDKVKADAAAAPKVVPAAEPKGEKK